MAQSDTQIGLILGGATIPPTFDTPEDSPVYHQELLAYVLLKNIELAAQSSVTVAWSDRSSAGMISEGLIDSATGFSILREIGESKSITIVFPDRDSSISYRGEES